MDEVASKVRYKPSLTLPPSLPPHSLLPHSSLLPLLLLYRGEGRSERGRKTREVKGKKERVRKGLYKGKERERGGRRVKIKPGSTRVDPLWPEKLEAKINK